jgi:hypothetical protein
VPRRPSTRERTCTQIVTSPGIISLRGDGTLVRMRFPLDDFEEAYQVLTESFGPRGKVILEVSQA